MKILTAFSLIFFSTLAYSYHPVHQNDTRTILNLKGNVVWKLLTDEEMDVFFEESIVIDGMGSAAYLQEDGTRTVPPDSDWGNVIKDSGIDIMTTTAGHELDTQVALFESRDRNETVRVILTESDLENAIEDGVLGLIYDDQWVYPIPEGQNVSEAVDSWFDAGIRMVQPAIIKEHNDQLDQDNSIYGGGNDEGELGLTALGEELILALFEHDILVDLGHVGVATAWDILELANENNKTITSSHANARAISNTSRNKYDDEMVAIAQTGGVIGLTPISYLVSLDEEERTTEKFIEHILHVVNLEATDRNGHPIDMLKHVALAADTDLNGWPEDSQFYLDARMSAFDRWKTVAKLLNEQGFNESDLKKVLGENLLNLYRATLPGWEDYAEEETGPDPGDRALFAGEVMHLPFVRVNGKNLYHADLNRVNKSPMEFELSFAKKSGDGLSPDVEAEFKGGRLFVPVIRIDQVLYQLSLTYFPGSNPPLFGNPELIQIE